MITKIKLARMHEQGIRVYKFRAVIHPKRGGDDYEIEQAITAKNELRAKELIRSFLSKKSALPDDFIITGELTAEECS